MPAARGPGGGAAHEGCCAPCPASSDVRGAGLLLAIELAPGADAPRAVARACLDRGLVVNAVTPTALRLAPSLLVTDAEIDAAVAILEEVLAP